MPLLTAILWGWVNIRFRRESSPGNACLRILAGVDVALRARAPRAIIDSMVEAAGGIVASLIVRGLDDALVEALKQRAAKHGRSAEAEHREILASALRRPRKRRLAEVLAAIPGVGKDEDFARIEDAAEAQRVSD